MQVINQSEEFISRNTMETSKPNINLVGKDLSKHTIRQKVWEYLEGNGISIFPRPVYGRIPNFKGCEEAGLKLSEIDAYLQCTNIEVNPDKPQESVRLLSLKNKKNLYVPVPRLSEGLLKLISAPDNANRGVLKQLVSRKGIEESGKPIGLTDNIHIDLLVLGSVAVSKEGYHIGKGRGYADLEYAVLREINAVDDETIIVTNVHDCQVFDTLPKELFKEFDVPLDYILTPTEVIKVSQKLPRPKGIFWHLISERRVNLMPILQELKKDHESKGRDTTLKEVDTDVDSYEPRHFNRFRRFRRRRPQSYGRASESQGEGDSLENKPQQHRRRYFRRNPTQQREENTIENHDSVEKNQNGRSLNLVRKNDRPRRPFRRSKLPIDFSLMVSNIEKTVRVRDLKNALIERGIKPNEITWRGYKGFCYLHYAKPNNRTNAIEPHQVDSVIEILQAMKICPDSETNLNVKILEKISRIETTDITSV